MKKIEVVAAVIVKENKVFCAKRADKGEIALKWEFPGGKIEFGESNEEALLREVKEELDSEIQINDYLMTVQHQYIGFHLTMHAYLCELSSGNLDLSEHVDSSWASKDELDMLDWAAADIPIVNKLKDTL